MYTLEHPDPQQKHSELAGSSLDLDTQTIKTRPRLAESPLDADNQTFKSIT